MNTPTSNHVRFVCRAVRGWAALGGEPEGNRIGSHHIAGCADCSRFFAAGQSLDFALRREAAHHSTPLPVGLEDRIVRAVQRSSQASIAAERSPRAGAGRTFVALAFAAAAAIVLTVFLLPKPTVPSPGSIQSLASANGAPDPAVESESRLWNSESPAARAFLTRNPLEEEAAAVYSDARSAVRFLAMNFLPLAAESVPRRASGG